MFLLFGGEVLNHAGFGLPDGLMHQIQALPPFGEDVDAFDATVGLIAAKFDKTFLFLKSVVYPIYKLMISILKRFFK